MTMHSPHVAEAEEATISATVAAWIAGLTPEDIPADMENACIDTVIDTIGLAIAARETPYVQALRKSWQGEGKCSVLGTPGATDPYTAAMINGTAGHGEDYDNTFEGCPIHSGVVIVPAVFAAAEAMDLSGPQVLKGLAVGMEMMCRLGLIAQKGIHSAGFHPTAILGAMGAAAGVGAAMNLDAKQIRNAMGVAGSMASGIIEYLADGSWTKRMHAGWAAQSGIRAAQMGAAGFSGPKTVFEGSHGLFKGFAPSITPDFTLLTESLGQRWDAARMAFKPFACGTMTQPYIDCAIRLAGRGIKAEEIEEMVCKVGEGTVHRLWEPLASKHRPPTPYAAKFSTPYCIAVGFLHGNAGLVHFTEDYVRNEQVLSLARKVRYEIDPANEYPRNFTGHIRAVLKSGEVIEEFQPHMRGGRHAPMTREELKFKCAANLAFAGWNQASADDIEAMALGLRDPGKPVSLGKFTAPQ